MFDKRLCIRDFYIFVYMSNVHIYVNMLIINKTNILYKLNIAK